MAPATRRATTRRADGTEMTVRKVAGARWRGSSEPSRCAGKARIFARLRWRGRSGTELTVPFRARRMLSGRLLDADGAGLAGRELRVVSRPSRGALGGDVSTTVRDRAARRLPAARSRPAPRAGSPCPSPATRGSSRRAQPADAEGAQRRRFPRRAARVADRRGGALQRSGAQPRGADATPRQAGRDPVLRVGREALAPGAGHPQRSRRPLPRQLPLPLRQRLGQHPAPRRRSSPRSAGPTRRAPRGRCRSRNRVG